jgi:hypothetical protein
MRLKAMNLGANAVAAPTCIHKDGIDWETIVLNLGFARGRQCYSMKCVWPNPSLERTPQRPLRALCAAARVER